MNQALRMLSKSHKYQLSNVDVMQLIDDIRAMLGNEMTYNELKQHQGLKQMCYKTVKLNQSLHQQLKEYCNQRNVKMQDLVNDVLYKHVKHSKKVLFEDLLSEHIRPYFKVEALASADTPHAHSLEYDLRDSLKHILDALIKPMLASATKKRDEQEASSPVLHKTPQGSSISKNRHVLSSCTQSSKLHVVPSENRRALLAVHPDTAQDLKGVLGFGTRGRLGER